MTAAAASLAAAAPAAIAHAASTNTNTNTGGALSFAVGAAPVVPTSATVIGTTDARRRLTFDVALHPRDPGGLNALVAAVSTPGSPSYHAFLKPGEFAARFGAAPAAVARVRRDLETRGLSVEPGLVDGLTLKVSGSAAVVGAALGTSFRDYRVQSRLATAEVRAPRVDASIASDVAAVVGLDGLRPPMTPALQYGVPNEVGPLAPRASHAALGSSTSVVTACAGATAVGVHTADQIATHYGLDAAYANGDTGRGIGVALVEFDGFHPSNVAAYQQCYGTSATVAKTVVGTPPDSLGGMEEADLDIEDVVGLAPGVRVRVYENSNTGAASEALDMLQAIATNDTEQVVSTSWGGCELAQDTSVLGSEFTIFQQMAAQGQTFFAASGDSGSEDCLPFGSRNTMLAVDDPASQPLVTGVGGTSWTGGAETVWNNGSTAGGGGVSDVWNMPSWQAPARVAADNSVDCPTPYTGGSGHYCRQVPDVSALADPRTGYAMYLTTANGTAWHALGGTSAAAPTWAALTALTDAECSTSRLGLLNPTLYSLETSNSSVFSDVTSGSNDIAGQGKYSAAADVDLATGIGVPVSDGSLFAGLCPGGLTTGGGGTGGGTGGGAGAGGGGTSGGGTSGGGTSGGGSAGGGGGGGAPVASSLQPTRVAGADRIATSVAASQTAFPQAGSAQAVVLTRSDMFADALGGTPLAADVHGPLLLTSATSLSPATADELTRVLAPGATVYVLGGATAVSSAVEQSVRNLGYRVTRIAGNDRFATATAVAATIGTPAAIFEADGTNFPDALSASSAAIAAHGVIVLTQGRTLPAATSAYVAAHRGVVRYAVGGSAAAADPSAQAIVGADRYDTSVRVAQRFFATPAALGCASGVAFADALSGGVVTGLAGGPMLLVPSGGVLPSETAGYLAAAGSSAKSAWLFGGASSVGNDVQQELTNALAA